MYNKSFLSLWAGQTLANVADVLALVAMISSVYNYSHNTFHTALVPFLNVLAQTISSFLAPLVLERYALRSILVGSQSTQSLLLLGMTILLMFFPNTILVTILGGIFLKAFLDGWTTPSRNALVPRLIEEDQLVKANSLLSTSDRTVQLIGWAIGGILVSLIGVQNV